MRGIFSAASASSHRTAAEVKADQQARRTEDIPQDKADIHRAIQAKRSI